MSSSWPPRFSAAELGQRLSTPYAREDFAPIEGPGAIILDLEATEEADARLWQAALMESLSSMPCVTIAIEGQAAGREAAIAASGKASGKASGEATEEASGEAQSTACSILARACDVSLGGDGDDLGILLKGFRETPVAALEFVQLLRDPRANSVQAGLVAESFVYSTLQAGEEFRSWRAERSRDATPTLRARGRHWLHRFRRHSDKVSQTSVEVAGPACRLDRDGRQLRLTLNRPEKHNAFSREMRDSLVEGLQLVLSDASIDSVLLCGAGASFCSGGDLSEFGTSEDPALAHVIRTTRSPAHAISQLSGRIRVEVHGACIGAGVELPAFADHVTAQESAFFQLPEVAMGLIPGAGGTVSLPRRIGRQRTAWLGLSGQRIDANRALAWGLVDEVRLGLNGGHHSQQAGGSHGGTA